MRWFMMENSAPAGYIPLEEWCAACPGDAGKGGKNHNPMACTTTISIYTVPASELYCVTPGGFIPISVSFNKGDVRG
jgi:hypothetical protein